MPDRVSSKTGEIQPLKGKRGKWELNVGRRYVRIDILKPRRASKRKAAIGIDPNEQRAAAVEGSILERIVYQRLELLVGLGSFDYKKQFGSAAGVNARVFIGGLEADFVVWRRPGRPLVIEPQGAHWHGPTEFYHDLERAWVFMSQGYDYAEIFEYEVWLGDEYLDHRLAALIGISVTEAARGTYGKQVTEATREGA